MLFCFASRYWELGHATERRSPFRSVMVINLLNSNHLKDGLSRVKYRITSMDKNESFTNYTVRLDPDLMEESIKIRTSGKNNSLSLATGI